MMSLTITRPAAALTMTSLEIEQITGSRHDSVKRTIKTLAEKGVIEFPQSVEIPTATKPTKAYLFVGDKGRRDSIVVVAQLCPEFTARIVDRWQELESQVAQPVVALPDFSNPSDAARAWADEYDGRKAAEQQLAIAAPKAEALDRIAVAEGDMCITDAAKTIGMQPKLLFAWLHANNWIYRRPGGANWIAYQRRIKSGHLDHKVTTVNRSDGSEKVVEHVLVTAKGLAKLAEVAR